MSPEQHFQKTKRRQASIEIESSSDSHRIWGVGSGTGNCSNRSRWRGKNMIGAALMAVRREIKLAAHVIAEDAPTLPPAATIEAGSQAPSASAIQAQSPSKDVQAIVESGNEQS